VTTALQVVALARAVGWSPLDLGHFLACFSGNRSARSLADLGDAEMTMLVERMRMPGLPWAPSQMQGEFDWYTYAARREARTSIEVEESSHSHKRRPVLVAAS
jgi:hypothetical protein